MKKILFISISFGMLMLLMAGCSEESDRGKLRAEILALHKATIQAHLEKDVDFFTKNISKDYFSVGYGEIRHPSEPEITEMFEHYFKTTKFENYSDMQEPIIGFSDDASMAWSIIKVNVRGTQELAPDSTIQFEDDWAWITLYKRKGNQWIRLGEVASIACD